MGDVGLLFTNRPKKEIVRLVGGYLFAENVCIYAHPFVKLKDFALCLEVTSQRSSTWITPRRDSWPQRI